MTNNCNTLGTWAIVMTCLESGEKKASAMSGGSVILAFQSEARTLTTQVTPDFKEEHKMNSESGENSSLSASACWWWLASKAMTSDRITWRSVESRITSRHCLALIHEANRGVHKYSQAGQHFWSSTDSYVHQAFILYLTKVSFATVNTPDDSRVSSVWRPCKEAPGTAVPWGQTHAASEVDHLTRSSED